MKLISLLSSGIDSPVATYLLSRKADELILIHGDIRPFTDEKEIKKFLNIAKHIKKSYKGKIKVYLTPHGASLSEFKQKCNQRFTCVFCKRMLLRYAEKIAQIEKADAIIMGDSLGQVASQTLHNIQTIEQAVKIPIFRPLIGFDKEDVVKIAKEIGTYDLSILPSKDCSAVPKRPLTMAKLDKIIEQENKLDIAKLVDFAVKNSKQISI